MNGIFGIPIDLSAGLNGPRGLGWNPRERQLYQVPRSSIGGGREERCSLWRLKRHLRTYLV